MIIVSNKDKLRWKKIKKKAIINSTIINDMHDSMVITLA